MIKKLTRTGNSIALVLDRPLLEELGLDENAEVEVSTNGQVIVITPKRRICSAWRLNTSSRVRSSGRITR